MKRLVLASSSPRRQELLRNAGFDFEVIATDVDEEPHPGEDPVALVERLALAKAESVARRLSAPNDDCLVLGADTTVVLAGEILSKPLSPGDARRMLEKLSGRAHEVLTGVALVSPSGRRAVAHEATRVFFRALSSQEIADYVASGEPLDKAGAYAIQGRAGRFVTRVEGDYFNIVGLPIALVDRLWREWNG